jgi:hypothetical protein
MPSPALAPSSPRSYRPARGVHPGASPDLYGHEPDLGAEPRTEAFERPRCSRGHGARVVTEDEQVWEIQRVQLDCLPDDCQEAEPREAISPVRGRIGTAAGQHVSELGVFVAVAGRGGIGLGGVDILRPRRVDAAA